MTTMDQTIKSGFLEKWDRRFSRAERPLAAFYSDDDGYASLLQPKPNRSGVYCLIGMLRRVRQGQSLAFTRDTIGCQGGGRYTGFSTAMGSDFKYFLSCGLPGKLEGERYKKTPELVERSIAATPPLLAEGKYLVFKPWTAVEPAETPRVVIFFAVPDVLSGLFTLANFRRASEEGVICPFAAGCGSIIGLPLAEARTANPRAVLGMFDPSARPHVESDVLTFAVPWARFLEMNEDMDESFLITPTWDTIAHRLAQRRGS